MTRPRLALAVAIAMVALAASVAAVADRQSDDLTAVQQATTRPAHPDEGHDLRPGVGIPAAADPDPMAAEVESPRPSPGDGEPDAVAGVGPTEPARPVPTTTASPSAGTGEAPATVRPPPAEGRYRYATQGTSTFNGSDQPYPAETSLVVEAAADGSRRHADDDLVQVVRYQPDGAELLVELQIRALEKVFRPAEPVLRLPAQLDVGQRWEWTARSEDRLTTLHQRSEIVGRDQVFIDGTATPCVVIEQRTTFEGDLSGSRTVELCHAPSVGVALRARTDQEGLYLAFAFANRYEQRLRSLRPDPAVPS